MSCVQQLGQKESIMWPTHGYGCTVTATAVIATICNRFAFGKGRDFTPDCECIPGTLNRRQVNIVEDFLSLETSTWAGYSCKKSGRLCSTDQAVVWFKCVAGAAHGTNAPQYRHRCAGL